MNQIEMADASQTNEFIQLMAQHQRRIYAFIRTQVRDSNDADDILQETSSILWKKFDQFDREADFVRWACGIARLEVLSHHRHKNRLAPGFSGQLAEAFSEEVLNLTEQVDDRNRALAECLEALSKSQRELIQRRYESDQNVKEIATDLQRSAPTVYRLLSRAHEMLFDCIQEKLTRWEITQ